VDAGAPVDYLRAYIADLGDHRALEQIRRILPLLTSVKVVAAGPGRDQAPLWHLPFVHLRVLELLGCDLSTSAARGLLDLQHTLERLVCYDYSVLPTISAQFYLYSLHVPICVVVTTCSTYDRQVP